MNAPAGTQWGARDGLRWLEVDLPGAKAVFATRLGGISEAPYDSLNLGVLSGDGREAVVENRRRLAAALELDPRDVVMGLQVHGSAVADHAGRQDPSPYAEPGAGEDDPPQVDGHVTDIPGLAMAVLVADCLPVALAGPRGVAVLHCGWRGLAKGILAEGVGLVEGDVPTTAAIGPGIGPCCYEVGDEVASVFGDFESALQPASPPREAGNFHLLDLREIARRQLAAASVEVVADADLCTSCNPDLLFSHRRDGERSGRQGGLAWRV